MRQIREILRLKYELKLGHRQIARACGVGLGTVSDLVQRAARAGLSWPLGEGQDDTTLERLLYKAPEAQVGPRAMPELAWIHQELRRSGVTLRLLWDEYQRVQSVAYSYSQFCQRYRHWRGRLQVSMRQHHRAGEKIFVDFAGQRPSLVDPVTGEVREIELFVGVLGASSYIYAEACLAQDLPSWIGAHVRMFEFFGGCSAILVPDNLKVGVTAACRYEPTINRTYEDLARYYGAAVVPARVRRPKDKAKVEAAVLLAERWILAALRNRTFFSLAELNSAIRELLERINQRPMRRLGVSRRELFERLDRPALKPLPAQRYELAQWKTCKPNIDYHVEVDHNFYSVPSALKDEELEARFTHTTVEVWFKDERIASHPRLRGRGRYSTVAEHMPAAHRAYAEWRPSRLIRWAGQTGTATQQVVTQILASKPHPEMGYRACLGLLRLGEKYGRERLEAACRRAIALDSFSHQTVKNILAKGLDRLPLPEGSRESSLPLHDNIRGADYFAAEVTPC
jgi:transposase